ncbi:MAG: sensor histidine kinase [Candidatus Odinarchaeota archaeon]
MQFSNENPVIEISEQFKSVDSFVLGDELIIEIFVNLMTNAIKYTDLEIKRVDVSWEPWVRNRDFSHVKVTDHGIGIPDDQKSHLFGRFSKIESTKGLGLGLNIVLGLVERYGGYIWFENRIPGDYKQGTVANVCLRRANQ